MGAAYESALVSLNISRTDPRTEQIAKRIIEVAQAGVREPAKISALAVDGLNFG